VVDMKLSPAEVKEYSTPSLYEGPRYPYGLRLDLDTEALEKLGLDQMPAVGSVFMVAALAQVENISASDGLVGEKRRNVCLQITAMDMVQKREPVADRLYGKD